MNRLITAGAGLALLAAPLLAATATASNASGVADARQAPGLSIKAKVNQGTAIAKEDTLKISGKVSRRAAGDKVVLQQRMETRKSWSVSGTGKVKANGTFVLKDEPTASGTRYYRVLKPAAGGMKKAVSKELEVVVYGWEALANRPKGPATGVLAGGATIATDYYAASLVSQTPGTAGSIEFTLGKKCTSLRATYALTDSSATGGTGAVGLTIDGRSAFVTPLALGQVVADSVTNVTGAFRIRFDLAPSATPDGQVAVATPEVLCTT